MTIRLFFYAVVATLIGLHSAIVAQSADIDLPFGASALTFGSDGTLYVAGGGGANTVLAIAPDGTQSTLTLSAGTSLDSPGGLAFDPSTGPAGRLLVTDNENFDDGLGSLLSIDIATGQTDVLVFGFDSIDDVAVRSSGDIFFTDAAGDNDGALYHVAPTNTAVAVVDDLGFAAGITFDDQGNVIFQDIDATDFAASIQRLDVTDLPDGSLSFNSAAELIVPVAPAGFDLVAGNEGNLFVTGSGGLFELESDGSGNFETPASLLRAGGFFTEVAFFDGNPNGVDSRLAFIPEFGSSTLVTLQIPIAVPEPSAGLILLAVFGGIATGRRRKR